MRDDDEVRGPFGYDATEDPRWVKVVFRAMNLVIFFAALALLFMGPFAWVKKLSIAAGGG